MDTIFTIALVWISLSFLWIIYEFIKGFIDSRYEEDVDEIFDPNWD